MNFFELGFCCNATAIATGSAGRAENDEFSLFSKSAKARASRPHSRRTYVHVKLRVQNNCEPEEPVGFERYFSRERVTALSGSQIHIDADEIAAIGDFSQINNGSIGGRENPPDFGNR